MEIASFDVSSLVNNKWDHIQIYFRIRNVRGKSFKRNGLIGHKAQKRSAKSVLLGIKSVQTSRLYDSHFLCHFFHQVIG